MPDSEPAARRGLAGRWTGRLLIALGVGVLGVWTGVCAVLLHGYWWGLLLGVAATVAAAVALPPPLWWRPVFALAWALTVARAAMQRPEGDYLIGADPAGYALLVVALVLIVGSFLRAAQT